MRVRSEKIFPQKFRSFRMIKNQRIQEIYVVSKKLFSLQTAKRGLLVQQILMHRKVCLSVCLRFRSPRGQAPDFSAKSISSRGFGAETARLTPFWNWDNKAKKMLGAEFWFSAHGLRKQGQKEGLARGPNQILEFQFFGTLGLLGVALWCDVSCKGYAIFTIKKCTST